jgi:flagellar motor switch protein FliG
MPSPASRALTGLEKAAVLLVSIGPEAAAAVTRHLKKDELESVTMEIAQIKDVPQAQRDHVLREFHELAGAQSYVLTGGVDYAQEMLIKGMGAERAKEIIQRVRTGQDRGGFEALSRVDADHLISFIQNEHPQTMALILARLSPRQAANVLQKLPPEIQPEVVGRIAMTDQIAQETFQEIESILQQHMSGLVRGPSSRLGGIEAVAEVLNQVERSTEKNIMGMLERDNPDLASQIKNLMFVFDDIHNLMDRDIQRVLKEVDSKDLALALKVASEEVKQKIFGNISQRASEMLGDEIEYLGPVRLKTVEEAQQRIVETIRRLEEAGEIVVSRGGHEEEIIV